MRSVGVMDRVIRCGARRPPLGSALKHALVLALTILALAAPPAASQTITVTVLDAERSQPVRGAVVQLHDEADELIGRRLTDERGRTRFFRSGAGLQRIRAAMIGMATAETEPFQVDRGATVHRELRLEPSPIPIAGLSVEGDERCRTGPAEGIVTARLWDEARTALTAAAIADEQSLYRFHILLFEQDLDRDRRVVERSRQSQKEVAVRTPFVSRLVEHLMRHGFVERSGGTDLYLAPDAHVLLSEPFLDSHCFGVREGRSGAESEGLVGLTFEPTADRGHVVEVAGTLWLDPNTSELQWLEFSYVNLDPEIRLDELGGRVDFSRMPDGGWIIPEWYIRMPNVALQRELEGDRFRTYVRGFREAGGRVLEVQEPGRVIGHSMAGAMEGVVVDSTGTPMEGVRVEVAGTEWITVTDSTGTFSFYPMVEGVYEIQLAHPTLERLGRPPVELTRLVVDGETTLLEAQMPSVASVVLEDCGAVRGTSPDSLPLLLNVRGVDGESAGEAGVQVTWSSGRADSEGFALDPDAAGTFTLCRVPRHRTIEIIATLPGEMGQASVEAGRLDDILSTELRLRPVGTRGRPLEARVEPGPAASAGSEALLAPGLRPAERAWLDSLGFGLRRDEALLHRSVAEIGEAYDSLPQLLWEVSRLEIRRRNDLNTRASGVVEFFLHASPEWISGSDDACPMDVYLNGSIVRQRRVGGARRFGIQDWLQGWLAPDSITAIELFDAGVAPVGPEDGCGALLLWVDDLRDGEEPPFAGSVRGRIRGLGEVDVLRSVRVRLAPLGRTAEVGPDGRFELGSVPPGPYTVQMDLPGVGAWALPTHVRAHSVAEISIDVNR